MNFTPHLFANRAVKGTFKDSNPNLIALKYNCEQEIWVRAFLPKHYTRGIFSFCQIYHKQFLKAEVTRNEDAFQVMVHCHFFFMVRL